MKGDGADKINVGDWIKVSGEITNYVGDLGYSTIEYKAGCQLVSYKINASADAPQNLDVPAGASQKQIVDLAFSLESGKQLTSKVTLTGTVKSIDKTGEAGEICLTFTVEGKDIYCYWLKGEGAESLKAGDVITVNGTIKNYNGKIEYDKGQLQ
jgi:hypothetical protein